VDVYPSDTADDIPPPEPCVFGPRTGHMMRELGASHGHQRSTWTSTPCQAFPACPRCPGPDLPSWWCSSMCSDQADLPLPHANPMH
jgi:hypothetical protein